MATLVKTAAFVALYRLFSSCFSSLHGMWGPVVAVLSALTMLVGNILAVSQYSIKRMLAYSSIAHAGYLLMAIAVMNELTAGSILYYAAAYSIGSLGVFALVLPLSIRGDERIDALKGLSSRNPLAAAALAVLVFSMAGMVWLVLAGILSSLIGVYYYFRMIHAAYSPAEEGSEGFSPDRYAVMMIVLAAVLSLVLGIVPSLLQGLI
jgi:NADH-quinone oxidoreductase subunit N